MPYKDKQKQREAQRAYEEKRKGTRHRGWVFLLYPESCTENWADLLTTEQIPACVSPMHDSDVNGDGTPKKPHMHVLALWDGPTSYQSAKALCDLLGGVIPPENPMPGMPKPWAQSVRAAARYLCHLDNPEKVQYDPNDVREFGGVDYFELIASASDDDDELDKMFDFIDENNIVSYAEFVRYCRARKPEWRRLVYHRYAAVVSRYIKSFAWESQTATREDEITQERREHDRLLQERLEREAGDWAMATLERLAVERLQQQND